MLIYVWEVEYTTSSEPGTRRSPKKTKTRSSAESSYSNNTGPGSADPASTTSTGLRHPNMKELRAERSLRVLFAFDPRRTAILLVGGHKGATDAGSPRWNDWYDRCIPIADDRLDQHLAELRNKGLT